MLFHKKSVFGSSRIWFYFSIAQYYSTQLNAQVIFTSVICQAILSNNRDLQTISIMYLELPRRLI